MPVVTPTRPNQVLTAAPIPVQITAPEYKGITVDTTLIPVSNILTHVEGSSWSVNYYSQVIDKDSPVQGQGLGNPAVTQQYRLIRQMELKVTGPLSASQDNTTANMTYTGTATVYPFVIPNKGDMFLADVGGGREGLFQITEVTRLSIYKQTCHSINYSMVDYSTAERRADLDKKTIQTLEYVRDFLTYGQNPLLFEEDYQHLQSLRRNYKLMVRQYFDSFFSKEFSTILLPGQTQTTYDPYLVDALLKCFTMADSEKITLIRKLNVQDDQAYKATSIWSVLLDRDIRGLINAFTQYGKVYAFEFTNDPLLEGARYSGVDQFIYPVDAVLTVDYNQVSPMKLVNGESLSASPMKMNMAALINPDIKWIDDKIMDDFKGFAPTDATGNPVSTLMVPPPVINNAMIDGYYVLSKAFYENDKTPGKQSQLEILVRNYLEGKAISYKSLDNLLESTFNSGLWNTMSRFYYIPILMILIKANIRSI